jgi:hypothetical protein
MWPYEYDRNPVQKEAHVMKRNCGRVQSVTREKAAMLGGGKDKIFNPEEKLLPDVSSSESFKNV